MKIIKEKDLKKDIISDIIKIGGKENNLKKYIIRYVGKEKNISEIKIGDIIEILARDFPEIVLAMAEENYMRGYEQALQDTDNITKMIIEEKNNVNRLSENKE